MLRVFEEGPLLLVSGKLFILLWSLFGLYLSLLQKKRPITMLQVFDEGPLLLGSGKLFILLWSLFGLYLSLLQKKRPITYITGL